MQKLGTQAERMVAQSNQSCVAAEELAAKGDYGGAVVAFGKAVQLLQWVPAQDRENPAVIDVKYNALLRKGQSCLAQYNNIPNTAEGKPNYDACQECLDMAICEAEDAVSMKDTDYQSFLLKALVHTELGTFKFPPDLEQMILGRDAAVEALNCEVPEDRMPVVEQCHNELLAYIKKEEARLAEIAKLERAKKEKLQRAEEAEAEKERKERADRDFAIVHRNKRNAATQFTAALMAHVFPTRGDLVKREERQAEEKKRVNAIAYGSKWEQDHEIEELAEFRKQQEGLRTDEDDIRLLVGIIVHKNKQTRKGEVPSVGTALTKEMCAKKLDYYAQKGKYNCLCIGELDGVKALVEMANQGTLRERYFAVTAMVALAANDDLKEEIGICGGIKPLLNMLDWGMEQDQALALRLITVLAREPLNHEYLRDRSTIRKFLYFYDLNPYGADPLPELQRWAEMLLRTLKRDPKARFEIEDEIERHEKWRANEMAKHLAKLQRITDLLRHGLTNHEMHAKKLHWQCWRLFFLRARRQKTAAALLMQKRFRIKLAKDRMEREREKERRRQMMLGRGLANHRAHLNRWVFTAWLLLTADGRKEKAASALHIQNSYRALQARKRVKAERERQRLEEEMIRENLRKLFAKMELKCFKAWYSLVEMRHQHLSAMMIQNKFRQREALLEKQRREEKRKRIEAFMRRILGAHNHDLLVMCIGGWTFIIKMKRSANMVQRHWRGVRGRRKMQKRRDFLAWQERMIRLCQGKSRVMWLTKCFAKWEEALVDKYRGMARGMIEAREEDGEELTEEELQQLEEMEAEEREAEEREAAGEWGQEDDEGGEEEEEEEQQQLGQVQQGGWRPQRGRVEGKKQQQHQKQAHQQQATLLSKSMDHGLGGVGAKRGRLGGAGASATGVQFHSQTTATPLPPLLSNKTLPPRLAKSANFGLTTTAFFGTLSKMRQTGTCVIPQRAEFSSDDYSDLIQRAKVIISEDAELSSEQLRLLLTAWADLELHFEQKLLLFNCRICHEDTKLLASVVERKHNLVTLNLSNNSIRNYGALQLCEHALLNPATQLRALFLENNQIGNCGLGALCEVLRVNGTLEKLVLDGNHCGDVGCEPLRFMLMGNSTLTALSLNKTHLTGAGVATFSSCLDPHAVAPAAAEVPPPAVVVAVVDAPATTSATPLSSDAFNSTASAGGGAVGQVCQLESLSLNGNPKINDFGAASLAHNLHDNNSLTHLDLNKCGVADLGCKELAATLSAGGGVLAKVWLRQNQITDEGAMVMCDAVAVNMAKGRYDTDVQLDNNLTTRDFIAGLPEVVTDSSAQLACFPSQQSQHLLKPWGESIYPLPQLALSSTARRFGK
jgi:hypothetical protein